MTIYVDKTYFIYKPKTVVIFLKLWQMRIGAVILWPRHPS